MSAPSRIPLLTMEIGTRMLTSLSLWPSFGSCSGLAAEAPHFVAVAAHPHVAPTARAAARRVREKPCARAVGASTHAPNRVRRQHVDRGADHRCCNRLVESRRAIVGREA